MSKWERHRRTTINLSKGRMNGNIQMTPLTHGCYPMWLNAYSMVGASFVHSVPYQAVTHLRDG